MPQILSSSSFNSASLSAPDTYIVNSPPPPLPSGVQTNVGAVIGTGSWGPLNVPVLMSSQAQGSQAFGLLSSASVKGGPSGGADPHDLCWALTNAFNQSQGANAPIGIWGVRVSDATDAAASIILDDITSPTPVSGGTLTALYTGTMGNSIKVAIAAGGAANTATVTLMGFANGYTEVFPNLPTATGAFWAALSAALVNGISGVRGPSQLARFTIATSTAAPALGVFTLMGGLDGRSAVTTAELTGSDISFPYTGAYALQGLTPAPSEFWIAGLTDNTVYAGMQAFADSIGAQFSFAFPTGTSSSTAVTDLQGYGVADYEVNAFKDWLYIFDPVNNVVRLTDPIAVGVGRLLTLSPEESPLNKPVYGVIGTERFNPSTGVNQPYSDIEVGQLNSAGIMFITNPCPGGAYFGFRTGVNTAMQTNQTEGPVEFARMTNFESYTIAKMSGPFVGQLQSQNSGDKFRAAVRTTFNSEFQQQMEQGMIDGYNVQCDLGNNSAASIAAHICYVYVTLTYLSSVWYFVAQLTGGTTVVTSGSTLTSALQGA